MENNPREAKHPVQEIADAVGGTIKEMGALPDGSGFAVIVHAASAGISTESDSSKCEFCAALAAPREGQRDADFEPFTRGRNWEISEYKRHLTEHNPQIPGLCSWCKLETNAGRTCVAASTGEGGAQMKCPHCGARMDYLDHGKCSQCFKYCGCSFSPTSMSDYCEAHRPKQKRAAPQPEAKP